jgi:polyferredoxin
MTKKKIMKKFKRPNEGKQKILGMVFLLILISGVFIPWLGAGIMFLCIFAGFAIAFFAGRKWCDWYCPRGDFFDAYISKISPGKSLPEWFYSYKFRLTVIAGLFTFLGFNVYLAWPNPEAIAFVFVRTLIITTVISIILAVFFRPRAWCVLCPVGTFVGIVGGKNKPLKIDDKTCTSCTICQKACPMGLAPFKDRKEGKLKSRDCIKCEACVVNCPKKSLEFEKK